MRKLSQDLLRAHHAYVSTDNAFQGRARLLQALWREARDLPMGERAQGKPLGSRLPLSFARETLENFLTDGIRECVRTELAAIRAGSEQLIDEGRLCSNLLSSQPLCFNLFGELKHDLGLAGRVLSLLFPGRVRDVTAVRFEYCPARGDERYTGDRSAFDVFIEHRTPKGDPGFLGIEVKYHENLNVAPAATRPRHGEVAAAMNCFRPECLPRLRDKPLEQIWRDHLLAGAMLQREAQWACGAFVFLSPRDNAQCQRAVHAYRECLSDDSTFASVTLEDVIDTIAREAKADWAQQLQDRYVAWDKAERIGRE